MKALTLQLRPEVDQPVDISSVTPSAVSGRTLEQLSRMKLPTRTGRLTLGEAFDISGDADQGLVLESHSGLLERAAAGLTEGSLGLRGHFGDRVAEGMRGGQVELRGRCEHYAANSMRGGQLSIRGEAGDWLGGALPDAVTGLNGGTVIVNGRIGDMAGYRMRRGLVLVNGDAGAYLGARMVAGTIVVTGAVGAHAGFNMRRGTLAVRDDALAIPTNFADCGVTESVYGALLAAQIKKVSRRAAAFISSAKHTHLYRGDITNGGLGELLVFATS